MAKTLFLRKVKLLTRKNLKIRFFHYWFLSICELGLPIIIVAVLGYTISSISHDDNQSTHQNADFYQQMNETRHDYVNSDQAMDWVRRLNIVYLVANNTDQQSDQLIEDILKTALESSSNVPLETNWKKRSDTEKELEVCVEASLPECDDIFAAVIFSKVHDKINEHNKFRIEYKIRFRLKDVYMIDAFHTDQLFVDYEFDKPRLASNDAALEYFCVGTKTPTTPVQIPCENEGLIAIQTFLDGAVMKYINKTKPSSKITEEIRLNLVKMPYATNKMHIQLKSAPTFVALLVSLVFSLTIFSTMKINSEKDSGFKKLLKMYGVGFWPKWVAWIISNLLVYSVWTLVLSLLVPLPFHGTPGLNLAPTLNTSCFLLWLLLFLFVISITAFSYLVSVCFEKVGTATIVGLVTWILLTIFSTVFSLAALGREAGALDMLLPPVALDYAFQLMFYGGGSFSTITLPKCPNLSSSLLDCLSMLCLDSFLLMILAMYLDTVLPSKHGMRKPYSYYLQQFKNCPQTFRSAFSYQYQTFDDAGVEMTEDVSPDSQETFEVDKENTQATVVIRNLKKVWNKTVAVDGLSGKMFPGEIFTLLGIKGAGKTTTVDILTGMASPTDGNANIFGLSIRKNMEKIRHDIGICPQLNLLSPEMSALDQVALFGKLKGLKDSKAKAEELLKWLDMPYQLHKKPAELSAGHKRRLQLAIALIGDPKLVIVDELTSGLVDESRREIWNLISKLRGKITLTLILTTDAVEEAVALGDRIGIISEGKMICCGTPSFLKKHYGVGYTLRMNPKNLLFDSRQVCQFIKEYIPNAKLKDTTEGFLEDEDFISISLPTSNLNMLKVTDLTDALREKQDELNVENIRFSLTPIDDVFTNLVEPVCPRRTSTASSPATSDPSASNTTNIVKYTGSKLHRYRFTTLFSKRMQYLLSSPARLFSLTLCFAILLWLSFTWLALKLYVPVYPDPPMVVSSLKPYPDPVILFHENTTTNHANGNDEQYKLSYVSQLSSSPSWKPKGFPNITTFQEIIASLKVENNQDLSYYSDHYLVGASFNQTSFENKKHLNITGFFSAYAIHSAPLSLNLISKALIKEMTGVDATISMVNHPFRNLKRHELLLSTNSFHSEAILMHFVNCGESMLFVIVVTLLIATAALLPTEERCNKGKQLQLMTGVSPINYWMSMFIVDTIFFSLINLVIVGAFVLADYSSGVWIFTNNGAGEVIYLLLECHLFAALWFSYLVSSLPCIKSAFNGFITINIVSLIIGTLWNVIRHILWIVIPPIILGIYSHDLSKGHSMVSDFITTLHRVSTWSDDFAWFLPMYSLFQSKLKISSISYPYSLCNRLPKNAMNFRCNSDAWKNDHSHAQSYFSPNSTMVLPPANADYFTNSALIYDLLFLLVCGVIWTSVLFALEYLTISSEVYNFFRMGTAVDQQVRNENVDVRRENNRVENFIQHNLNQNSPEAVNQALIVDNIHVYLGNVHVVKGISFVVDERECFGLLGANSADKTVLFRALSGDLTPSAGSMYVGKLDNHFNLAGCLSSIGYCPQVDAIIEKLTGFQMVKLYGALRGIPRERVNNQVKLLLDKFGLLGSARVKCADYSDGMKRRLMLAMAFIGNPKILLLDEPIRAVDAVNRSQIRNAIREARDGGQSVVLSSHIVEECEELCTRIGIIVNGKFKCVDTVQNLKDRFGQGFCLTVNLKKYSAEEEEEEYEAKLKCVCQKIVEEFSPSGCLAKNKFLIHYQIRNISLRYSNIICKMEKIRSLAEIGQLIVEYSVTEINSKDMLLSLASESESTDL